jgi:hypothetical protein
MAVRFLILRLAVTVGLVVAAVVPAIAEGHSDAQRGVGYDPMRSVNGRILFQDNFETATVTGPNRFSGWAWMQSGCGATSTSPRISFVPGYRAGSRAVRMEAVAGVNAACELSARVREMPWWLGKTIFIGQRFRYPAPFYSPSGHQTITQTFYQGFRYSNISMTSGAGSASTALTARNGAWSDGTYSHLVSHEPIDSIWEGVWHEQIQEIKLATGNTGVHRVWHKLAGKRTWTLVHEELNVPTMQWGNHAAGETLLGAWRCITKHGYGSRTSSSICNPDEPVTFFTKVGIYRGAQIGDPDTAAEHDVYVEGTTRAIVKDWLSTH